MFTITKAGRLDHIEPVRAQLTYLTKQQALNFRYRWSIYYGQL